ncbi:hypothetical protein NB037_02575 [Rathayibacter sp. ZW T2_19]|uniref:Uncharacterized protein n=1 Tax=Rathayibacter rubneri TaxID=2950106 RepID=A0A9X2DUB3_9MICO|nr:hypothetical protein [Rathayibacter rubneri]MCM6761295.1 hypothetical protein [Rathayibacter rubneri]
MIPLRADVTPLDALALPVLLRRLRDHRHVQVDAQRFLALIPGVGSTLVTDGGVLAIDVMVEHRGLAPLVIDALETELRRDGFRERIALRWSTPDIVPVPFR